ncbi:MAG: hypothetical protein KIS77_17115 [Saprospiraceae bacterium]|nr:hypothetical protein [Saprospiraceae bacterium]
MSARFGLQNAEKVIFVPTVLPTVYRHHSFAGATRFFLAAKPERKTGQNVDVFTPLFTPPSQNFFLSFW